MRYFLFQNDVMMAESGQPVISLLDMDCFYVQVEAREDPRLAGRPAAVVQYNTWQGGGIIAVNYEARARGVSRSMRGAEAREKCPDIELVTVPVVREKANLSKYRKAGREVIEVLLDSGATVERASIDEAYLDLTKLVEARLARGETVTVDHLANTWLGGEPGHTRDVLEDWVREAVETGGEDLRLAVGARIMEEVRAEVWRRTQFRCSAGISHCKTLAKLCCGLNKPNKQTVLPQSQLGSLYQDLRLTKVRGLGGKLGESVVTLLGVETMADLAQLSLANIGAKFEARTAHWLHLLAQGKDGEVVKERELAKSIGCGKNFRGKEKLESRQKVEEKVTNLVEELVERLEEDRDEYSRMATGLTVGVKMEGEGHVSRAGGLPLYTQASILTTVMSLLGRLNTARDRQGWSPAILNISISAGKFVSTSSGQSHSITAFFSSAPRVEAEEKQSVRSSGSPQSEKERDENSKPKSFYSASTSALAVTPLKPPPRQASKSSPTVKSFFKMKILEDLANIENRSESSKETITEVVCNPEKHSSEEDLIMKKPPERLKGEEEDEVIDVAELIPSLATFDPSLMDFLPPRLQIKARERISLLQEQEKTTTKVGTMVSFLKSSEEKDTVEDGEDCVECEVCHKKVSGFTLPEHLDWHYAVSVSKQSSKPTEISTTRAKQTDKRKREGPSGAGRKEKSKKPRTTDISKFFTKS